MNNKRNRYTSRYNLGGKMMYQKGGSKKGFPDLTGDGKITQADILKGRGVFKTGGVKDPNPGITALRKEAPEVVKRMGYGMGGMKKMYGGGGYKIRYQAGGMYGPNEIPPGLGSTAMTVYQESDPNLQKAREEDFEKMQELAREEGDVLSDKMEADKAATEQKLLADEATQAQTAAQLKSGLQTGAELTEGAIHGAKTRDEEGDVLRDELGNIIYDAGVSDFDKSLIKTGKDLYGAGTPGSGITAAAPKGTVSVVNKATGEGMSLMPGAEVPAGFTVEGVSGGSKLATGLSKAASGYKAFGAKMAETSLGKAGTWMTKGVAGGSKLAQMANPAAIVSLAGMGVSALSNDKDPTTFNTGEATGSIMSGAGTGAGIGSMILPGLGSLIGAGVGGIYSGVSGLIKRNKARDEEAVAKKERELEIRDYNEELSENFAMQKARLAAGNVARKTYSGYDLGQNVTAQLGGLRMGMPRYS